jgi:ABC-type phosphate transport system auxiliary subunit|tara:strand:- start:202 stop:648 length:447 start_codon:yes stop_codon:yes gene_type:complete
MEAEFGGVKFKGGKIFAFIIAMSTFVGGLYGAFEIYQRYLSMEEKIDSFISPDLSHYDEQLAVLKSEVDMILGEITLVNDVTQSLGTNIKTDIRNMNNDIRHITEIVNDIEDRQKEDSRELLEELKIIEEELDLKINKALNNPLASMK